MNETTIVKFRYGLDQRAGKINKLFDDAEKAEGRLGTSRLNAGRELLEARGAVENELGPNQWEAWCKANINRGLRDIRRVMKLAGDEDPELALKIERNATKEAVAKHRTYVSPVPEINSLAPVTKRRTRASPYSPDPVRQMIHSYRMLNKADKARFVELLKKEMDHDAT